jgi:hydroxymethylglutaryl-CoA lyase
VPVRGYVSTAFHCPFEGPIAPEATVRVAEQLLALGCTELSIGDTIGRATPDEVRRLLELLRARVPVVKVALHFHDTFGQAVENARAGEAMGVRVFDASAGGLGGCPYAPGAPGNVSTQALVHAFGARTGLDLAQVERASAIVLPARSPRG